MDRRSVKHWRPDPLEDILGLLEEHTVDSKAWADWTETGDPAADEEARRAQYRLQSVATVMPRGRISSIHITDDRDAAIEALKTGADLVRMPFSALASRHSCPGLMLVEALDYWRRFLSGRRYDFLDHLSIAQKNNLYYLLHDRLDEQRKTGYITQGEFERAWRDLNTWYNEGRRYGVDLLVGQPYNIDVPYLAKKYNIAEPQEPDEVRVVFWGRYLDIGSQDVQEAIEELAALETREWDYEPVMACEIIRRYGWDGVFVKFGFTTSGAIYIMNGEKILQYGGWWSR